MFSNIRTAVVMRRGFETFVTADLLGIDNPQSVIAAVCLRDLKSYEQLKGRQSDHAFSGAVVGELISELAGEVADALLRQIRKAA